MMGVVRLAHVRQETEGETVEAFPGLRDARAAQLRPHSAEELCRMVAAVRSSTSPNLARPPKMIGHPSPRNRPPGRAPPQGRSGAANGQVASSGNIGKGTKGCRLLPPERQQLPIGRKDVVPGHLRS